LREAAGTHDAVYRANKEGGRDYRAGVKTSDAGGKFPDRDMTPSGHPLTRCFESGADLTDGQD